MQTPFLELGEFPPYASGVTYAVDRHIDSFNMAEIKIHTSSIQHFTIYRTHGLLPDSPRPFEQNQFPNKKIEILEVEQNRLEPYLSQVMQLTIPLTVQIMPIVLDGGSYHLKTYSLLGRKFIDIQWHADPPLEWKAVIEWFHNFQEHLHTMFD